MCKKATSCLLALLMVCTLALPALADEKDYTTTVSYTGTADEEYTLTVPATLAPGNSGDVTLSGTWDSEHTIKVSADTSVTVTADIGGSKELAITFPGISLDGSNTDKVSETKQVSVEDMTALFGTWTGTFNYYVGTVAGFTLNANNLAAIGCTDETTDLTIPATFVGDGNNGTTAGVTYKITKIAAEAFKGNTSLESVTISEGITSIGDNAFYYCSALESINIPESVTSIGEAAFHSCSALESVNIPDSVTSIGLNTFLACSALENITFSNNLTTIGESAFRLCTNLKSIVIPDSVTSIGSNAFAACTSLADVTLSSNLVVLDGAAFSGCSSLKTIDIPSSVETIGPFAFMGSGVGTINIHNTEGSIPEAAGPAHWGATSATVNWLGKD